MDEKSRVATLAVFTNIFLTAIKLVVGVLIGSVSVLAEALHSAVDLVAAGMALFAVRTSAKPADAGHPYGHGKVENVTGTLEALLIFLAAGVIIWEAVQRLLYGVELPTVDAGLVVIGISVVVNFFVSRRLLKVAKETESVALEADAYHLTSDVLTSAGVFIGLLLVRITGLTILDPIIALVVAVMILKAAWEVTQRSFVDLLDRSLPEEELERVRGVLASHGAELVDFHKLRSRKSGSDRHLDLHLVVHRDLSVGEAHALCDRIEADLAQQLGSVTVNLHVEPCVDNCDICDPETGACETRVGS
ncbi:MAG: cation diffusion facilitator family transporter [Chloroflexota bacterium]